MYTPNLDNATPLNSITATDGSSPSTRPDIVSQSWNVAFSNKNYVKNRTWPYAAKKIKNLISLQLLHWKTQYSVH